MSSKSLFLFVFLAVVHAQTNAEDQLLLTVSTHGTTVIIDEEYDLKLSIPGITSVEWTLVPVYDPPESVGIVDPVENVTVLPGVLNWEASIPVRGRQVGHVTIVWKVVPSDRDVFNETIKTDEAFTSFTVIHSREIDTTCAVVGWIYFAVWSVSFWPQIYENWRRKSVIGLNFDYVGLNILGHNLYGIFNYNLYWNSFIQEQYIMNHPYGVIPVLINDVVFSIHASIMTIVTGVQCYIYERGDQKMSWPGIGFLITSALILICSMISVAAGALSWLSVLYICSYIKLAVTITKYIPQAIMNYQRKSTEGWSISAILMDFTGGVTSMMQMFLLAYNNDDWTSMFGNPTKFLLGFISVLYDIVFMFQHYVLYRHPKTKDPIPEAHEHELGTIQIAILST